MRLIQLSGEPNGNRASERRDNTSYHNYSGLHKVTRLTANGLTLTSSYPNIPAHLYGNTTSGIDTDIDQYAQPNSRLPRVDELFIFQPLPQKPLDQDPRQEAK
jgi:hypothetical protein